MRLIGSQKKVSCENQTLAAWLKLSFVTPDFRTGSAMEVKGSHSLLACGLQGVKNDLITKKGVCR